MTTESIGETKTADDFLVEVYALVEKKFPISLTVDRGQLVNFTFETEWKEGSTKAVEKTNDEGETFID